MHHLSRRATSLPHNRALTKWKQGAGQLADGHLSRGGIAAAVSQLDHQAQHVQFGNHLRIEHAGSPVVAAGLITAGEDTAVSGGHAAAGGGGAATHSGAGARVGRCNHLADGTGGPCSTAQSAWLKFVCLCSILVHVTQHPSQFSEAAVQEVQRNRGTRQAGQAPSTCSPWAEMVTSVPGSTAWVPGLFTICCTIC